MRFRSLAVLVTAALVLLSNARAEGDALPGGFALGMTLPQLRRVEPAMQRVARPARLAGGLVGAWSGGTVDVAGVALTPTFFFAGGVLRRVEYLVRDAASPAASYAGLRDWARQAWGPELAAEQPEGAYASWSKDDADVYLQLAGEQVRLVVRQQVRKDAGEL